MSSNVQLNHPVLGHPIKSTTFKFKLQCPSQQPHFIQPPNMVKPL
jgi:hypothetical protein